MQLERLEQSQRRLEARVDARMTEMADSLLAIEYANIIIFSTAIFALLWAYTCYIQVKRVEMKPETIQINQLEPEEVEQMQREKV